MPILKNCMTYGSVNIYAGVFAVFMNGLLDVFLTTLRLSDTHVDTRSFSPFMFRYT